MKHARHWRLWAAILAIFALVGTAPHVAHAVMGFGAPYFQVNSGPTITSGTAAPSASAPEGSVYFRTGGSNGAVYARASGAWVALGAAGAGVTLGGDATGASTANTVGALRGMVYPAASAGAAGNSLQYVNSSTLGFSPVNLADLNGVTGTLPRGQQQAQNMGGDISGTTAAAAVATINSLAVSTGIRTPGYFTAGATPASTGGVRLPNNTTIAFRNAANSADIGAFRVGPSNETYVISPGDLILNGAAVYVENSGSFHTVFTAGPAVFIDAPTSHNRLQFTGAHLITPGSTTGGQSDQQRRSDPGPAKIRD